MLRHHNAPPQFSHTFTEAMHSVFLKFITKWYNKTYNCEMSWSWTRWVSWLSGTLHMAVRPTDVHIRCCSVHMLLDITDDHTWVHNVTGHHWWSQRSAQCYWTPLMITVECTMLLDTLMITVECTMLLDTLMITVECNVHYYHYHYYIATYCCSLLGNIRCLLFLLYTFFYCYSRPYINNPLNPTGNFTYQQV